MSFAQWRTLKIEDPKHGPIAEITPCPSPLPDAGDFIVLKNGRHAKVLPGKRFQILGEDESSFTGDITLYVEFP